MLFCETRHHESSYEKNFAKMSLKWELKGLWRKVELGHEDGPEEGHVASYAGESYGLCWDGSACKGEGTVTVETRLSWLRRSVLKGLYT